MEQVLKDMLPFISKYGIFGFALFSILAAYMLFPKALKRYQATVQFRAYMVTVTSFFLFGIISLFINNYPSTIASQELITTEKTQEFLLRLDSAISAKDIEALIALIASDATISIESEDGKGKTFSRADYKYYANNAFSLPSSYKVNKVSDSIHVIDDGKRAVVTSEIIETSTLGSFICNVLSKQVAIVEIRNSSPIITSVIAKTVKNEIYRKKIIDNSIKYVATN